MKLRLSACLTAMMALACAGGASAETVAITADNTWHAFDIDELMSASGGLDWISLDGSTLSFTFTTASDALLTIVDGGFAGDSFNIFDNGVLLGVTSTPVQTDSSVVMDFDAALANANYSFATYLLSAGSHTITGTLNQSWLFEDGSPLNATVGGLRVTPVPLPGALLLLLSGTGALGFMRRRKTAVAV